MHARLIVRQKIFAFVNQKISFSLHYFCKLKLVELCIRILNESKGLNSITSMSHLLHSFLLSKTYRKSASETNQCKWVKHFQLSLKNQRKTHTLTARETQKHRTLAQRSVHGLIYFFLWLI